MAGSSFEHEDFDEDAYRAAERRWFMKVSAGTLLAGICFTGVFMARGATEAPDDSTTSTVAQSAYEAPEVKELEPSGINTQDLANDLVRIAAFVGIVYGGVRLIRKTEGSYLATPPTQESITVVSDLKQVQMEESDNEFQRIVSDPDLWRDVY